MACPRGNWSSVAPELADVITTKIGWELFVVPHQKVLEESVQHNIGTTFHEWMKTSEKVSDETCRCYLLLF